MISKLPLPVSSSTQPAYGNTISTRATTETAAYCFLLLVTSNLVVGSQSLNHRDQDQDHELDLSDSHHEQPLGLSMAALVAPSSSISNNKDDYEQHATDQMRIQSNNNNYNTNALNPLDYGQSSAAGRYTGQERDEENDDKFNSLDNERPKTFIDNTLARQACHKYRGTERRDRLNDTFLRHCNRYKFDSLLASDILMSIMHDSSEECERIIREFIQLDELVRHFDHLFRKLLSRYNCHNGYSVKWNCDDCKRAYTDWLCATSLPFYMSGEKILPCISFCERVEQRCPYLHPITKEQYGGQPVFICRDPNIPYVPKITPDIPYGDPYQCYDLCHISDNTTELIIDSLSKYDYTHCPRKEDIAARTLENSHMHYDVSGGEETDSIYATPTDNGSDLGDFNQSGTNLNQPHTSLQPSSATQWVPVHVKKLKELKDVLAVYRSQPKGHGFSHHSDHSAVDYGGVASGGEASGGTDHLRQFVSSFF